MGRARRQQGRSAVVLPGHTPAPAPDAGPAHFVEALGHRRPRAGRALGPGTRHAAGRRRASHDPVHGARRLHGAGRRRDAGRGRARLRPTWKPPSGAESVRIPRSARVVWSTREMAGCITRTASNAPCAIRCGQAAASPSSRTRCNGSTAGKWSNASRDPSSHRKTGTGGDDMKHASTRGAVRIAATPAANASRRAVRRVAASAVTLLALYAHAAGAQQNPWTSVSSARCPRPPAISARTSATPSCWPSRKAAASSAGAGQRARRG